MADIVDTLRHDKDCLVRMTKQAGFAGAETRVRVKNPMALIVALEQGASEITRLRAESAAVKQSLTTASAEAFERAAQIAEEVAEKRQSKGAWEVAECIRKASGEGGNDGNAA